MPFPLDELRQKLSVSRLMFVNDLTEVAPAPEVAVLTLTPLL